MTRLFITFFSVLVPFCLLAPADPGAQSTKRKTSPPSGSALTKLVERYLDADAAGRKAIRAECDERYVPLTKSAVKRLRKGLLKAPAKQLWEECLESLGATEK